jgi:hypothetical protein
MERGDDRGGRRAVRGPRTWPRFRPWPRFRFRATRWEGEAVNREPAKHSDVRWFPLNALPEPDAFVLSTASVLAQCVAGAPGVSLHGWDR